MPWSKKDIPSQAGKVAIVTGSYGGLGYEVALGLVEAGATVIIAGRSESKGKEAVDKILALHPNAKVSFGKVDLGNFASVAEFATDFNSRNSVLDLLVNNAGIMMPPKKLTSSDGLEIQIQTNHLAHFALTAHLLPALRQSTHPRVVNVSSIAAKHGKINFEDLSAEKSYSSISTYQQSKLANLLFTFELQRRSDEKGWGIMSVVAHPGYSRTDLISSGPGDNSLFDWFAWVVKPFFSLSAAEGALPLLFAATAPEAKPAGYYGPQGFYEVTGPVGDAWVPAAAKDTEVAKRFWDVSVSLTNAVWP